MFKQNKYTKHYMLLIEKAKNRKLPKGQYKERHHIIPKSLGGTDDRNNLVWLTGREHALCHWALLKMTEGENYIKMSYAFNYMKSKNGNQHRYTSRILTRAYERHRIEHAKIHSNTMKGRPAWNKGVSQPEEQKEKNRQAALQRGPKTPESIEKWKKSREGYRHSDETKLKQSKALKGKPKPPASDEHRAAISRGTKGKKKTENHADNIRKANIGNISINKDGIEKKVKRDTLDQWLAEGWQLGGRKRK